MTVLTVKEGNMTNSTIQLQCPRAEGEPIKIPASIEAIGTATQKQLPDEGHLEVLISEEASTPEEAWTKFQAAVEKLLAAIGTSATVGTIEPAQDSKTVSATLRGDREVFCVSAEITIYFDIENFGSVIAAMAENGFSYSNILFTYSDKIEIGPELLEAASKDALIRAEAVARGVGKTVGRLVSIQIGRTERKSLGFEEPIFNNVLFSRTAHTSFTIDPRLFDVKMASTRAHVVVAEVTARFEILD
jgi:uncharacterized protein YggE